MKKLIIPLLLVFLCGCSGAQIRELFLGMSVEDVQNAGRKYTETFDLRPAYCYEKALESVREMGAQPLHEDRKKYFITANRFDNTYKLCIDTTQLGILITPLEDGKSVVEVASGDYSLAKFVSERLFDKLTAQKKPPVKGER